MSDRFFHSSPIAAEYVTLDGAEAHHLLHVGRTVVGQQVKLFDGSGCEFVATVAKLGRSTVELRIVDRRAANRELPFELIVGVALPKGDRQKWLVEKLTELGVTCLVPLMTERGVAQPTGGALERLKRGVIEASKQCGRNRLMQIADPRAWPDWVVQIGPATGSRRFFAHPGGAPLRTADFVTSQRTCLAIGPEGGFTDLEVGTAAAAGWQAVGLGSRILRIETAAVALAGILALGS